MPRLIIPTPVQVRAILEESHGLWGAGLTVANYVGMWEELAATPWGRRWFSWRAWIDDDGGVLASLKLYRPALRVGATVARAAAIGAVYTPQAQRRRGFASSLINAVLEEAGAGCDPPGLLFTDIGTAYYQTFGFHALPCEDTLGSIPVSVDASGLTLRSATPGDLDAMARTHERSSATRSIAVMRDREHWEFLLVRAASFFRRLDGSGLAGRFAIAEEGPTPVGYVVSVGGAGEWNLREAGAYDGSSRTLARILRAAGAAARASGATTVWGWLPRTWAGLVPEWRLKPQPRARAIPMLRPAAGAPPVAGLDTIDGSLIPYLDQF